MTYIYEGMIYIYKGMTYILYEGMTYEGMTL